MMNPTERHNSIRCLMRLSNTLPPTVRHTLYYALTPSPLCYARE